MNEARLLSPIISMIHMGHDMAAYGNFNRVDADNNKVLNYEEFTSLLFGIVSTYSKTGL